MTARRVGEISSDGKLKGALAIRLDVALAQTGSGKFLTSAHNRRICLSSLKFGFELRAVMPR